MWFRKVSLSSLSAPLPRPPSPPIPSPMRGAIHRPLPTINAERPRSGGGTRRPAGRGQRKSQPPSGRRRAKRPVSAPLTLIFSMARPILLSVRHGYAPASLRISLACSATAGLFRNTNSAAYFSALKNFHRVSPRNTPDLYFAISMSETFGFSFASPLIFVHRGD